MPFKTIALIILLPCGVGAALLVYSQHQGSSAYPEPKTAEPTASILPALLLPSPPIILTPAPTPSHKRDRDTTNDRWFDVTPNIDLLLIDAEGRRVGVINPPGDYLKHNVLTEIPGADYIYGHGVTSIYLQPPVPGSYDLLLQGVSSGPFNLAVQGVLRSTRNLPKKTETGVIQKGQQIHYRVKILPYSADALPIVIRASQ